MANPCWPKPLPYLGRAVLDSGTDFADFGQGPILVNGQPLLWKTDEWLSVCRTVINAKADWIGVHCYWSAAGGGKFGMENPDSGGMYWQRYRTKFPDKLLFITEFSNNSESVPPAEKGRQYANYFGLLRKQRAIGAAFSFALFWQGDPHVEGWVTDEGGRFKLRAIPGAVGTGLANNPVTAQTIPAHSALIWDGQ